MNYYFSYIEHLADGTMNKGIIACPNSTNKGRFISQQEVINFLTDCCGMEITPIAPQHWMDYMIEGSHRYGEGKKDECFCFYYECKNIDSEGYAFDYQSGWHPLYPKALPNALLIRDDNGNSFWVKKQEPDQWFYSYGGDTNYATYTYYECLKMGIEQAY